MSNLPVPIDNQSSGNEDLLAVRFTEGLPSLLFTLLERRYLTDFQLQNWRIEPREGDIAYPVLHEVVSLGKPQKEEHRGQSMPYVLTACHEPGHALVMVLHGQGDRHRLYFGGRRLVGMGARSSEDYLLSQEGALKAYFAGLMMSDEGMKKLDHRDLPEMSSLLQGASTLAIVTGIPSGRGGQLPLGIQSLDRLARAVGNQRFILMVVAEPLAAQVIEQVLDACRRLKGEVHAYIRRSISRSKGGAESVFHTSTHGETNLYNIPIYLRALNEFLSHAYPQYKVTIGALSAGLVLLGLPAISQVLVSQNTQSQSQQRETSWQDTSSIELLDANAEACEQLLQRHIERLAAGRSGGWWQTAVYIAAESEAAQYSVIGALRSLGSGDASALDPLRVINVPVHMLRSAVERGQILTLYPRAGVQGHPLGKTFDTLATCLNSEELAVIVNLPQEELPGLPMRTHSDFALSVPSSVSNSISLGVLQDNLGHSLQPVTLTAEELSRHCFITGLTGYGKTNTCMQILLEAYNKLEVPFLVLEPTKTEYRHLAQIPELKGRLRVYSLDRESPFPFRLNPLDFVPGMALGHHIDLLRAVFNISFPMSAGMSYTLEEALLHVYAERGWSQYTSTNPFLSENAPPLYERSAVMPCLQDLHGQIEAVFARKKYGQEASQDKDTPLLARLQSLMRGSKGLVLNTRRSVSLDDLFAGPTVVELQNLGNDEEKLFVMALLFILLYEYALVRRKNMSITSHKKLLHLTLIEEGHRLLQSIGGSANLEVGDQRSKAISMFTDILAEMRAYSEGILITDQFPTRLAPEALKNTNLKIVHRLAGLDDRQVIGGCMNLNDQQMRHLNNFAPGLAAVHNERISEAVLTKIYPVKEISALNWLEEGIQGVWPVVKRKEKIYLYRHDGCRSCPSPCDFYYHVEDAYGQAEVANMAQPFLEDFLLGDVDRTWIQWERWREEWRSYAGHAALLNKQEQAAEGVLYCVTTQVVYDWLGDLLKRKGQKILPQDRILREQMAYTFSKLIRDWTERAKLDDGGRKIFTEVCGQVKQLIGASN